MVLTNKHPDIQANFMEWLYTKWINILLYIKIKGYKGGKCEF